MADRPILFSAPMIRALLEGRKTMTRRAISKARVFATPERPAFTLRGSDLARAMQNADRFRHIDGDGWFWEADAFEWQHPHTRTGWMAHLGYAPGDRLWVRETARAIEDEALLDRVVEYRADGAVSEAIVSDADTTSPEFGRWWDMMAYRSDDPELNGSKWVPPIHMPRWASRLTLIVESVTVERLQDISTQDAVSEGVDPSPDFPGSAWRCYLPEPKEQDWWNDPRESFRTLWESINGGGAWRSNPWVVAISFRVTRENIDSKAAR